MISAASLLSVALSACATLALVVGSGRSERAAPLLMMANVFAHAGIGGTLRE